MGGNFRSVLPYLEEIKFPKEIFIDTGAEYGFSIDVALEHGFKIAVGIEYNTTLSNNLIKKYEDNDKVYIFKGSSPNIIPIIISRLIEKSAVFYHDARFRGWNHYYNSEEYDPERGECPLIDELKALSDIQAEDVLLCVNNHKMYIDESWNDHNVKLYYNRLHWPSVDDINRNVGKFDFVKIMNDVMIYKIKPKI